MEQEAICIPKKDFETMKRKEKVNTELLQEIARGIRDILQGKVKEI